MPASPAAATSVGSMSSWPAEKRLAILVRLVDERQSPVEEFLIHGFHALRVEGPGVLDLLLADLAELRVHGRVVLVGGPTMEHPKLTVLAAREDADDLYCGEMLRAEKKCHRQGRLDRGPAIRQ